MTQLLKRLFDNIRGAASVEYAFILGLVVLAMMSALNGFADESSNMWNSVASKTAEATGN